MPATYMIHCTYRTVEGGMKIAPCPDPRHSEPGDIAILKFVLGDLLIIRSRRRKKFIIDLKPSPTIYVDPDKRVSTDFYATLRPEWVPELFRIARAGPYHNIRLWKGDSVQYRLPDCLIQKTRVSRFTIPDLVYPKHLLIPTSRVNVTPNLPAVQLSLI